MCDECRQNPCDARCPNNTEEIDECCAECGNILEKGEEVYVNNNDEVICLECMENLEIGKIIDFFNLQKEVVQLYKKAEEFADKKLKIISKNRNLTVEEKEIYRDVFFEDYIQNTIYERAVINDLLHIGKR